MGGCHGVACARYQKTELELKHQQKGERQGSMLLMIWYTKSPLFQEILCLELLNIN